MRRIHWAIAVFGMVAVLAGCDCGGNAGGCEAGRELCDGICVDTSQDPRYCNSCGTACALGEVCVDGACEDAGDCRQNGCSGFSYCDTNDGLCKPGCTSDDQCPTGETCLANRACSGPAGDGGTSGGGDGGWGSSGDGGCQPVTCQGHLYQCGNCIDDDGADGIDYRDPDCLGPCDNNESGFSTEIPGGHSPGCGRECYFDQDNGGGNDECAWSTECDPLEPEATADSVCLYDASQIGTRECKDPQPQVCHDVCKPLVPNGCDCFGCCELPAGSGRTVFIGTGVSDKSPTCTLDVVMDETLCRPCTQMPDCLKTCGRCQLCIGKTEVPEDCWVPDPGGGGDGGTGGGDGGTGGGDGGTAGGDGGGGSTDGGFINPDQCPGGEQPCGLPGQDECPASFYCITGCCQFIPG